MSVATLSSYPDEGAIGVAERPTIGATEWRPLRLKALTIGGDIATIAAAFTVSFLVRFGQFGSNVAAESARERHYLLLGLLAIPIAMMFFSRYRLFNGRQVSGRLDEFRRLVHANLGTLLVLALYGYLMKSEVARG